MVAGAEGQTKANVGPKSSDGAGVKNMLRERQ